MTKEEKDWEGRPVLPDEPPDAEILVWCIDPPDRAYRDRIDTELVRGWQDAIRRIADVAEGWLEDAEPGDLESEGFTLKISLKRMTKREYDESMASAEDY